MILNALNEDAAFFQKYGNGLRKVKNRAIGPSQPDHNFEIIRDWICMKDGVRLSVTYFMPKSCRADEKFPVILELLPYRKDDLSYIRDYPIFSYFARRGYACAKVDIRGTGSSEGALPEREYSDAELSDAEEIIDHLSKASWSNGNVGMFGISWGGFNSLQTAMRRPPALKAVIALHASDDLYHDDIHFIDGIFHMDEYHLSIHGSSGLARSPDYSIDEAYLRERFDQPPWILSYLKNQKDGDFWRKGSVRWNKSAIKIPVYLIGGLLDGYRDCVLRMKESLKVPVKAEIGPWNHSWPDNGTPGPNYEWRAHALRWWDHWLKNKNTGLLKDQRLTVFVRHSHEPDPDLKVLPGYWAKLDWPVKNTNWKTLNLSKKNALVEKGAVKNIDRLLYAPAAGIEAGYWWGEMTGDMRGFDRESLVYDSALLKKSLAIIGFPKIRLRVLNNSRSARWVARLEDVHPDGKVSLVAGGALNGSQYESGFPSNAMDPGKFFNFNMDLHFTTWIFRPGHKIRLAISNGAFPMLWPMSGSITSKIYCGSCSWIKLPVAPADMSVCRDLPMPQAREERGDAVLNHIAWPKNRKVAQDSKGARVSVDWEGEKDFNIGAKRYLVSKHMRHSVNKKQPADSAFLGEAIYCVRIGNRRLELRTVMDIRSDKEYFKVIFSRKFLENGKKRIERKWKEKIIRDFQ
ncbi:CocE/NonD family hydrolase [Elusimicrobiota bacterium]